MVVTPASEALIALIDPVLIDGWPYFYMHSATRVASLPVNLLGAIDIQVQMRPKYYHLLFCQ
jgi:hypothetical protein